MAGLRAGHPDGKSQEHEVGSKRGGPCCASCLFVFFVLKLDGRVKPGHDVH